ncbi:hypothetical protein Tco_0050116, partial [Tanacetum coccineum]
KALKDGKLKNKALINKAIMEGMIDDDDESSNEGWRSWDEFKDANNNRDCEDDHDDEEGHELFDDTPHELPVCNIRRFEMIKYSFRDDEECVDVKKMNTMI